MRKRFAACGALVAAFVLVAAAYLRAGEEPPPVTLTVGHVGHDHQAALFVALDRAVEYEKETGISVRVVKDRRMYELSDSGGKIADLEIIVVGGGSKMPTALAQNVIDVGLGGVAPVLSVNDRGAPVKIIAPLHYKGDMLAVRPDFPAKTWDEFVAAAKNADAPLRIGYKDPIAVAKIVFEEALRHEEIPFSGDPGRYDVKILMVNVKGGGKLNVSLAGGLVDGYVGNNPFPAIGEEEGILRIIADLEELPPGRFRDHPCCCVAANVDALEEKEDAVTALLTLLVKATGTINSDLPAAAGCASRWIGTSQALEERSMAASGYSMEPSEHWHATMATWIDTMNEMGLFEGRLAGLKEEDARASTYDFTYLEKAKARLAEAKRAE